MVRRIVINVLNRSKFSGVAIAVRIAIACVALHIAAVVVSVSARGVDALASAVICDITSTRRNSSHIRGLNVGLVSISGNGDSAKGAENEKCKKCFFHEFKSLIVLSCLDVGCVFESSASKAIE